jgi:hypothetical protein
MSPMPRKGRITKKLSQRRIIAFIHLFLSGLSRPQQWLLIIGLLSVIGAIDYFNRS